jgi:hypothetical protein
MIAVLITISVQLAIIMVQLAVLERKLWAFLMYKKEQERLRDKQLSEFLKDQ